MGSVYFAQANNGLVKIGWSKRVFGRLRSLLVEGEGVLVLRATVRGTMAAERRFHRRFMASRAHGEWFRNSGELRRFLEEPKACLGIVAAKGFDWQLRDALCEAMRAEILRATGSKPRMLIVRSDALEAEIPWGRYRAMLRFLRRRRRTKALEAAMVGIWWLKEQRKMLSGLPLFEAIA